eukprot:GHVN01091230.1.p1 GENE.GHVN01091230.1~~GHVN01091230.1.p1  ORF type:complete len:344 (-),score=99.31 GHVN01091230.1:151-1029(-)
MKTKRENRFSRSADTHNKQEYVLSRTRSQSPEDDDFFTSAFMSSSSSLDLFSPKIFPHCSLSHNIDMSPSGSSLTRYDPASSNHDVSSSATSCCSPLTVYSHSVATSTLACNGSPESYLSMPHSPNASPCSLYLTSYASPYHVSTNPHHLLVSLSSPTTHTPQHHSLTHPMQTQSSLHPLTTSPTGTYWAPHHSVGVTMHRPAPSPLILPVPAKRLATSHPLAPSQSPTPPLQCLPDRCTPDISQPPRPSTDTGCSTSPKRRGRHGRSSRASRNAAAAARMRMGVTPIVPPR